MKYMNHNKRGESLRTDRNGNIYFDDGTQSGWYVRKVNGGWIYITYDDEKSDVIYKTKRECIAATGLDLD